jgi:hypothetical protein
MRAAVFPIAMLLAGCAAVDVSGPYANGLLPTDIRQIKTFVISDPHLISPWIHVTAVARDRVQLEHGGLTSIDGMTITGRHSTKIFLVKRGDKWNVDGRFPAEGTAELTVW